MFAIRATNDAGLVSYAVSDPDLGVTIYSNYGGKSLVPDLRGAKLFETYADAEVVLNRFLDSKVATYTDGQAWPNREQHNAIGLNNTKTSGFATFEIVEVSVKPIKSAIVCWPYRAKVARDFSNFPL